MKGQHNQLALFFLPRDSVYNGQFREACELAIKNGKFTSWSSMARACGFVRNSRYGDGITGDSTKLRTLLGLKQPPPSQNRRRQMTIHRKTAIKIINGLDLDPVDFDL